MEISMLVITISQAGSIP